MPPPFPVELVEHDPRWPLAADAEAKRLREAIGDALIAVHHIGSTAIAGIRAKPILDLMPVVADLDRLDARRFAMERLGYDWWGEFGLTGRRYCVKTAPGSGRRLIQLHCFALGAADIDRHLAFRDHLRSHPGVAAEYDRIKERCRALHPHDSHVYGDCKSPWIAAVEAEAMRARLSEPTSATIV